MYNPLCRFAVASCTDNGGIYEYALFEDGEVELCRKLSLKSPMWISERGGKYTSLLRAPVDGRNESAILTPNGESIPTLGKVGCHFSIVDGDIYCANYVSGSVFKTPDIIRAHRGRGTDVSRQLSPHPHGVFPSPDGKYIFVCDLGTDEIYTYDKELNELFRTKVPDGSGARHLCFSADGKYAYCINEMSATLSVFSHGNGILTYIRDTDLKPAGFCGQGKGGAIKRSADGERLYLTERGSGTVVFAATNGDDVKIKGHYSCGGVEPRDIALVGAERFLICANQFSDDVAIFEILSDGSLKQKSKFKLCAPICIIEIGDKL